MVCEDLYEAYYFAGDGPVCLFCSNVSTLSESYVNTNPDEERQRYGSVPLTLRGRGVAFFMSGYYFYFCMCLYLLF